MRLLSLPMALALVLMGGVSARADVLIRVDKAAQRMTVSVDGVPRYDWTVSTGKPGHETPSGAYRVQRLARDHFSREWDNAPMPYAMFFTGRGHAIHGSGHVRALGRPASHGCVRLPVGHAATLFALVQAQGAGNTRVLIGGSDALVAARGMGRFRMAGPRRSYRERDMGPDADAFAASARGYGDPPLYAPAYGYGHGYGYGYGESW